jgi:hypothetical protein
VHDHDAGVLEDGGRPRLPMEPLLERGPLALGDGEADLDRLERDSPAEVGVGRAVHDPHHSTAELALDLVAAEALRDFGAHRSPEGDSILQRPCRHKSPSMAGLQPALQRFTFLR